MALAVGQFDSVNLANALRSRLKLRSLFWQILNWTNSMELKYSWSLWSLENPNTVKYLVA